MRFGIFSYNFHPEPTGIPAYNTGMARWLAGHGWEVVMHTGIPHYPWWRIHPDYAGRDFHRGRANEVLDGVEVRRVPHYIPSMPVTGGKRIRLDASWILSTCLDCLRIRKRPDAIVMIAPPFLGGLLGVLLGVLWRCPVLYHVQDLQIDAALDLGMLPPRLGRVMLWCERLVLRHADQVTTISEAMRRRLEAKTRLPRPVALFPNWTDTTAIRPHQGANAYREQLGLGDDDVLVLYSGNLGRKQGLEFLLDAFAKLPADPKLHFLIAGDGAERQALEARARELGLIPRLRFMSLAPAERLSEFLGAGDVHCIPQRRAAADLVLPSKLTNILAAGRAFVATAEAHTDLGQVVAASGGGLLCAPEDATALAGQLGSLIADGAQRRRLGERGRAYAVEHLGIDRILMEYAQLVEKLVQERCGRP